MKNLAFIVLASSFFMGAGLLPSSARAQDAPPPAYQFGLGASFLYGDEGDLEAGVSFCLHEGTDLWRVCADGTYDFTDGEGFDVGIAGRFNERNYLWGGGVGLYYATFENEDGDIEGDGFGGGFWVYANVIALTAEQPEIVRHIRAGPVLAIEYEDSDIEVHTSRGIVELSGDATAIGGGILFEYELPMANGGIVTLSFESRYTHVEADIEEIDLDDEDVVSATLGVNFRF